MPRSGTLVICVQNLDYSGANQVVLNIVQGRMHSSNVIVLSPKIGLFAARFVQTGAAVRFGDLGTLLDEIRDVICIICNTIMTADVVFDTVQRPHPVIWIIHEWWTDEMITENFKMRNISTLTLETVKIALKKATMIVFVCEKQRLLYNPTAPSTVIFVGVPPPEIHINPRQVVVPCHPPTKSDAKFCVLVLGIVCPRKNQIWAVQIFREFARDKKDMKLLIVGARYTRPYEIDYLNKLKEAIGDLDSRIEIHDVTNDVDGYYDMADCLLVTSTNEVTPMVIPEAMSRGIPIIATNIGGIDEMITNGAEGFLISLNDTLTAVYYLTLLYENLSLRQTMGCAGKKQYAEMFDLDKMVERYRQLVAKVASPIILIDLDGTLVDWDKGFLKAWKNRTPINRSKSYYIEQCVDPAFVKDAIDIYCSQRFFEELEPVTGGISAIQEMIDMGFQIILCSTPIYQSKYCVQEKLNWIEKYLGQSWFDKTIFCAEKATIRGDILIDDKPFESMNPYGRHTAATWRQVIFDAPYNKQVQIPRLDQWGNWKNVILPLLDKSMKIDPYLMEYGERHLPRHPKLSPRTIRVIDKKSATAHEFSRKQSYFIGEIKDIPIPEDLASVAGSGSFFLDEANVEKDIPTLIPLKSYMMLENDNHDTAHDHPIEPHEKKIHWIGAKLLLDSSQDEERKDDERKDDDIVKEFASEHSAEHDVVEDREEPTTRWLTSGIRSLFTHHFGKSSTNVPYLKHTDEA